MNTVLQSMISHAASAQSSAVIQDLCATLSLSQSTVVRYLEATALASWEGQQSNLESIFAYVRQLSFGGFLTPLLFVHRQCWDETLLRLTVSFAGDQASQHAQLAKSFVTQSAWGMVLLMNPVEGVDLYKQSKYLFLHGVWSADVQASDSTAGPCIAQILHKAPQAPDDVKTLFARRVHLAECDEAGSNIRGLRMLRHDDPSWSTLTWFCSCRKGHAVAEKVWALAPDLLSSVIHALLAVLNAQHLQRLRVAVETILRRKYVRRRGLPPSSSSALAFRKATLDTYLPGKLRQGRARAVLLALTNHLNGDWRDDTEIQHYCVSEACCASPEQSLQKASFMLSQALRAVKPVSLCRANWLEWAKPFQFLGYFSHVHRILPQAFEAAFAAQAARPEDI